METFALIEQNFLEGQGKILGFCASQMCDRICHSSMLWQNPAKTICWVSSVILAFVYDSESM
jgi:hypothetical protein